MKEAEAKVSQLVVCLCHGQNNTGSYVSRNAAQKRLLQIAHIQFITHAFYSKCVISYPKTS